MVSLFKALKKYFFSGIAAILPLFLTLYIIVWILLFFDRLTGKLVNPFLLRKFGFSVPGLGLVVTILAVVIVGILYTYFIGKRLYSFIEKLFLRIPFVSAIYPSLKQLSDFLFRHDKMNNFKKVVLVEYPSRDLYAIGFITNENLKELTQKTGSELISVFLPFPPSPFSGLLVLVPKDKITELDISIDEALKFIVSGGVVQPKSKKPS
ncbi:MAG: DUF502 domain-containing protein [Candidatus Omnitrophota bacterium]|jgi:uncharacterized membrane protein